MPKVRRTPPPLHSVVVDTNILWDKDKKLPVCQEFDKFWARNTGRIPLKLRIPEVVFGELHFQQATSALKVLSGISDSFVELSGITSSPYSHKCNDSTVKAQVKSKLEKWLKSHGGVIDQTPVSTIDWSAVVQGAIWRRPPFTFDPKDKNNEKGFRDALILETLTQTSSDTPANNTVVFLCNDFLLRTTAEARLRSRKNFLAFESLADFEAYINLTQEALTSAFVKGIQAHARTKFFTKGDPNCIYSKLDVRNKIQQEFASDLTIEPASPKNPNWKAQMFWIGSTRFLKLDGEREFYWASRVTVARLYEQQTGGLLAQAMPPVQKIRTVEFDVKWKANVKADGRFHDIELQGNDKLDANVLDASPEALKRFGLVRDEPGGQQ